MEDYNEWYSIILKKRKQERSKKKPLTEREKIEQAKKWTTFYRRNWNIYAKKDLGIPLHFFQEVVIYLIGISNIFYLMCGRGLSKSFLSALSAFIQCMLYPNSEIVLTASTIKQAKKMVVNKMQKELCGDFSPKLKWLYENGHITFKISEEDIKISFLFNGSWIMILPDSENARGERVTGLLFEEARMLKLHNVTNVFLPMTHSRNASYLLKEEYQGQPDLIENSKVIYLTSTRYKHEWFWKRFVETVNEMFNNKKIVTNVFAGDIETSIYHGFTKREEFELKVRQGSEMDIDMEYRNIPQGEVEGAYYGLEMFKDVSLLENTFIPPTPTEYIAKYLKGDVPYFREKREGEIRAIYVDFAFTETVSGGQDNDNTVIGCMAGYPDDIYNQSEMYRDCEYMETYSGGKKDESSLRIRELFYLYKADVLILDLRNGGEDRWQDLSKPYYHDELGINMNGFGIYTDNNILSFFCEASKAENLRSRVVDINSIPVTIPVIATQERNNNYHIAMKNALLNKSIRIPMGETELRQALEDDMNFIIMNSNEKVRRTLAHVQFDMMVKEAIKLEQVIKNGFISLKEPRTVGSTKDRIVATEYGNYFFHLKELEMIKNGQEEEFDFGELKLTF